MAEAFSNPVAAPEFMGPDGHYDHAGYEARCKDYRAQTEDYIRTVLGGKHKVTGKVIRFSVADGYAQYMLWTPTKWIHLEEVDGYQVNPALIRGMRTQDVIAQIESQERLDALFARSAR